MLDDELNGSVWLIGIWLALTIIQIPRFYFDAYSSNSFVFFGDLIVPKLFFLIIAAALVKERSKGRARHVIFLSSVFAALTLPQLWAPFWLTIGIFFTSFLLASVAFVIELINAPATESD